MRRPILLAVIALSATVAAAVVLLFYLNFYLAVGGSSKAVCAPTRLGDYLFEAYVMPATPREGEEFQITALIQGLEGESDELNITLFLLKPGRLSIVDGPSAVPLGVKTWRLMLTDPGFYEVSFIFSGPRGSGKINGQFQIVSASEMELHSSLRTAAYISLWIGTPLLAAILIYSKMSS